MWDDLQELGGAELPRLAQADPINPHDWSPIWTNCLFGKAHLGSAGAETLCA